MQTSTSPEPLAASASLTNDASLAALAAAARTSPRKRISSQALLGSEREIEIEHGAQLYRLRLTALGKLILTK
jgi:hemin uptake protein HemP